MIPVLMSNKKSDSLLTAQPGQAYRNYLPPSASSESLFKEFTLFFFPDASYNRMTYFCGFY